MQQQQRKMQQPLAFQLTIHVPQRTIVRGKRRRRFDGTQAVLVDRVFVVGVKLQQTPGMLRIAGSTFQARQGRGDCVATAKARRLFQQ